LTVQVYAALIKMGFINIPSEEQLPHMTNFWELRMKPFVSGGESVHNLLTKIHSIYAHLKSPELGLDTAFESITEATRSWNSSNNLDIEDSKDSYIQSLSCASILIGRLRQIQKDDDLRRRTELELEWVQTGDDDCEHPAYRSPQLKTNSSA
jgi:hypothetical protein